MRQVREILRLKYDQGLGHRDIAKACGIGVSTVTVYCQRAEVAGLGWPLPPEIDDGELESRLFRRPTDLVGVVRPRPDWAWVHQELKRPGVTLQRLCAEFLEQHPTGHRYSQYCAHYHAWRRKLAPSMRQVHRAGEKAFVDFSGKRPSILDRATGELIAVELFVGVLGASRHFYAEACQSQDLACWIGAHVHMVEYWGGCPALFVPDNLRSGVSQACRYEPDINRSYLEFARHYGAASVPARPGRPKDKAAVETHVLVVQRWILARLRHRRFFTLAELNAAIRELLAELNARPMQRLGVSRQSLFEQLDRPALRPLPTTRYELAIWKTATVNIDYHIAVDGNLYSTPFQLRHKKVEARIGPGTVEIFFKGRRIASHRRAIPNRFIYVTDPAHMPAAHRAHAQWSPSRLILWAEKSGPNTGHVATTILATRTHPEQGYRACLGLMRLAKKYGPDRLEAACARARHLDGSYRTVHNILISGMDRVPVEAPVAARPTVLPTLPAHPNIRGSAYYATTDYKEDFPC